MKHFPHASLVLAMATVPVSAQSPHKHVTLESLAIQVPAAENRAVSFTNKDAAYYYTQTHRNDHPEHAWFRGLNIAGRRIWNDYHVVVGGATLDPAGAQVVVWPDAMIRTYPSGLVETLRMFDHVNVVEVSVAGATAAVMLRLTGDQLQAAGAEPGLAWYRSTSGGDTKTVDHVAVGRRGDRFLIAVGPTQAHARRLWRQAAVNADRWTRERRARLESLLNGDRYLQASDSRLTRSLRWVTLTTDELVTRQRGAGIYAGLPWFNEYWGRDSFIALAGATLVTGQFADARAILTSFARFQDLDTTSATYGRLPNIVKPGSIDYHTADGTPRWVIGLRDYVRYSADRSIVRELYPNVAASIDGSLRRFTDSSGYLVHAANETWMDARREPDHASYSPRATRANDIQALWYEQLTAGAELASMSGRAADAERWSAAARRLKARFARDFVDDATGRIADHLDARDVPDFTLRPNLFFSLDLVDDHAAARATRRAWEALIYPWGTATLDQGDPFFHPYHVAWEHYHKDEAYHNGTVWPWLDGIAMQRMIERGQVDIAWQLFSGSSELALTRGTVGGLPETMDAYPHPGESRPRLTGTFLQAWSNAEWLRVWYQDFLGVQPDLAHDVVVLAPRVPDALESVEFSVRVGRGTLAARYDHVNGARRFAYRLGGLAAALVLDVAPFETTRFAAASGDSLVVEVHTDVVHARLVSARGVVKREATLTVSADRRARQTMLDGVLRGTSFAMPRQLESHPVLRQVYRRPP